MAGRQAGRHHHRLCGRRKISGAKTKTYSSSDKQKEEYCENDEKEKKETLIRF
jgi:hypothetical protein